MWFGTADGISRYDGSQLINYKYKSLYFNDVVNNVVRGKILEDELGNIYYCNQSGIYKWDRLTEVVLRIKNFSTESNGVYYQMISIEGNKIWILDVSLGLSTFDIKSRTQTLYSFPANMHFTNILSSITKDDSQGNIWIRLNVTNDPYILFNKKTENYSFYKSSKVIHSGFFFKDNTLLEFDSTLIYINNISHKEKTIVKTINQKIIPFYTVAACKDNQGRLWMASRTHGLFSYDEKSGIFNQYHHDNSKLKSLPFDITTCLFMDRNENLWIGMDGGGVAKLDLKEPKFNIFPLSYGDHPVLTDYFTKCFYEDEKGRIWFGSQTSGLNIYDHKKNILTNYQMNNKKGSLPGNIVASIIKSLEGKMIIGSSGGISVFNEAHGTFTNVPISELPLIHPTVNNFVNKLLQLKNGDILAATMFGIIRIRKKNKFYTGTYFKEEGNLTSVTTDIVEMPDGIIYATLPNIGMVELHPSNKGYETHNLFLNAVDLRSVIKDERRAGFLWIGSGKGLIHFDCNSHQYQLLDEKDGLANSYVYGVLEDSLGGTWLSTNHGLSYYSPKENKFTNYTYQDGLQSNEFNTQAFYKSPSGYFYFGGIRGFNWFRPSLAPNDQIKPMAAVTAIEINGKALPWDSSFVYTHSITLPYDKNYLAFHFAALDYTRPDANRIQYTLKNWDAGWVATFNKFARYANLPPGDYTLLLKVSNPSGQWSDEEKIHITITPPYWKRTWFILLYIFLFVALITMITYRISQARSIKKVRLLEKQIAIDTERNRISADMHDEIGSSITHIALFSELIQTQHKTDTELKNDIKSIAVTARKLVQTMGDIIWALNPQNDTMEVLLIYIREQAQQYFDGMEILFRIEFPTEVPHILLSNAIRRNLYLVTREGLNNALKHSGASEIILKLEIFKKNYCFIINDNGTGMPSADKQGNGIKNLIKRMEDIGGTIEWVTSEKGTIMKYCVDL